MQISIKSNIRDTIRWLGDVQKQVPFATAKALTKTAQSVKAAQVASMRQVFDRPTPFTLNSLYLTPAKKTSLEAKVWLKDRGSRPHYLLPEIEGGSRGLKRFEARLVQIGVMGSGERAVPGEGAQLDSFGNMNRGQIVKILSQLGSVGTHGDTSVATNSRRSRAKRAVTQYFVSRGRGEFTGLGSWKNGRMQNLPRGIWQRTKFAQGTAIRPVLLFVKRAEYRKRFDFYGLAEKVVAREFQPNFEAALRDALKTVRRVAPA